REIALTGPDGGPICKRCNAANPPGSTCCWKCKCYVKGTPGPVVHSAYSRRRSLLLAPIRHEMRTTILADIGHTDSDVRRAMSIIIDQLIEARLIAQSYFEFLAAAGGPITTKGRQRRCVEGWCRASDRVAKFAQMIGLERRRRHVNQSPIEWLES